MDRVKKLIHYPQGEVYNKKFNGNGIHVAVLDTGISNHPDMKGRIRSFVDCVNHRSGLYDNHGHGTHIAGIIGGNGQLSKGQYAGIAPEVIYHIIKVLDYKGNGEINCVEKGIDWVLKNHKRQKIRIVNISVGTLPHLGANEGNQLVHAVEELWNAGIIVVTSAGNYGPARGSITLPGASRKVITVGAVDDQIYISQNGQMRRNYSGRGPTKECVCKPEILAPGSYIKSCNYQWNTKVHKGGNPYCIKSGTSMATPVVSGALACLLCKYPHMSNLAVKLALRDCATDLGKDINEQGWGLIDMEELITGLK